MRLASVALLVLSACAIPPPAPRVPPPAPPPAPRALPAPPPVPPVTASPPTPPASLTASDGTGLAIASLAATARVVGPLAETELSVVFENPDDLVKEGRFRLALPPRAFVTRLAMRIDGTLREASIAPVPLARATYDDTLHARRDPLLVEQADDNALTARVFPIPARGQKEIVVGWVQELSAANPVTIPLRGLPRIGRLEVRVTKDDRTLFAATERGIAPRDDVRVVPASGDATLRTGGSVVTRLKIATGSQPAPLGRSLVVLLDTSASRAPELDEDLDLTRRVLAQLANEEPGTFVTVLAFDQEVAPIYEGTLAGFGDSAMFAARARGALGASNLERALWVAAGTAARTGAGRLLFVGEGLATAGVADRPKLLEATASVPRVDVLAVGRVHDDGLLRALARGGIVASASEGAATIAARLRRSVTPRLTVNVPGARFGWPKVLEDVQDGDERFVYAELPAGAPARVEIGGEPFPIGPSVPGRGLAARIVAKARIDALGRDESRRAEVVALARKHRVPSPYTALLVLESAADEQALEARALELTRPPPEPPARPTVPPPPPARPSASTTPVPPPARPPAPTVLDELLAAPPLPTSVKPDELPVPAHVPRGVQTRESLACQAHGRVPPEAIQLVVRRNWGRFRGCYEAGLRRTPGLRGRVVTKLLVGEDGRVARTEDAGSDLPDPQVIACIVDAFGQLGFPASDSAFSVTYPFSLWPPGTPEAPLPMAMRLNPHPDVGELDQAAEGQVVDHQDVAPRPPPAPWNGAYADVRDALRASDVSRALAAGWAARRRDPDDAFALLALGEALTAAGQSALAARAFGSIADLHPHRADLLRVAGGRLGPGLAVELLRRARDDRPDHPSSHHLVAMALLEARAYERAFEALAAAVSRPFSSRFIGASEVLAGDLAVVVAAWRAAEPARADEIDARARRAGVREEREPTTRFVLSWETDASDVDLHVTTRAGGPLAKRAASFDGYGPELVVAPGTLAALDPRVEVELARAGPSGQVAGVVDVVTHDGRGGVAIARAPFVLMNERARLPVEARATP